MCFALTAAAIDSDRDGIDNELDNCQLAANANQRDTDGDGYGNLCDGDLDNNGLVNVVDLRLLRSVFGSEVPHDRPLAYHADLNGDGRVDGADFALQRAALRLPPGPAAEGPVSAEEAARLLTQGTYGPTVEAIDEVVALGSATAWVDAQLSTPISLHTALTRDLATRMCFTMPVVDAEYTEARLAAWWENALYADDQLRQRVAFALSQILVVSDVDDTVRQSQFALADYYDMLLTHAFGNYRDLLEDVSTHAVMGIFLSSIRNERAQPERNIRPDENFAREIMQLFTIGTQMLNLDGTPVLDDEGQPIRTYTQADIEEFARVYTGWNYPGVDWSEWWGPSDRTLPMEPFEEFHDSGPKVLLGVAVPGGQTAQEDLDAALDVLFAHPNVGPFLAKQLIKRLITSNPSPPYVARVAEVFNDNGQGVRGDLAAVAREIFLDPEARSGQRYEVERFGKLREPLLRITQTRRAFDAIIPQRTGNFNNNAEQCGQPEWGWYRTFFRDYKVDFAQQPLSAPSVFNFYLPDYAPPGELRDASLVAPEFEVINANTAQTIARAITWELYNEDQNGPGHVKLDVGDEVALASDPEALLDHLDLLLMSGQMSQAMRALILEHLRSEVFVDGTADDNTRARDAIMLVVNAPEYLIQK